MKRIEGHNHARFLTFSCYRNLDLLGTSAIRDEFVTSLARARETHTFALNAWVVMPNHVHLMLFPDNASSDVAAICRSIKQPFAQRVIKRWSELKAPVLSAITKDNGVRQLWQPGGGYDRNIFSETELREKIEYIHANPVRAGLVTSPTQWAWSSARWWAGMEDDALPMNALPL